MMASRNTLKKLAKFIAYVLGRRPDEFGLVLDRHGYVKIKEFLKALAEEDGWKYVRRSHLNEILLSLPDPPIEINGERIRAAAPNSLATHQVAEAPPKVLFTGVRRKAYPAVHTHGIRPSHYRRVVLSADREMAARIGRRSDSAPVILSVLVSKSQEKGTVFYQAGPRLYLADGIAPDCFHGPPLPKEKPEARQGEPDRQKREPAMPGSFLLQPPPAEPAPKSRKQSKRQRKQKRQPPPWRS